MLYLSKTDRVLRPEIFIATDSGMSNLRKLRTPDRLRSWNNRFLPPTSTFARLQTVIQMDRKSLTGFPSGL